MGFRGGTGTSPGKLNGGEVKKQIVKYRKMLIVVSQAGLLVLTYYISFLLRFDFLLSAEYQKAFVQTILLVLTIKMAIFIYFRLFRGWWRYVGMSDLLDIIKAASASAVVLFASVYLMRGFVGYPRSVITIDMVLTILAIGGMRFAVRAYTESTRTLITSPNALIIGAGSAGNAIARIVTGCAIDNEQSAAARDSIPAISVGGALLNCAPAG